MLSNKFIYLFLLLIYYLFFIQHKIEREKIKLKQESGRFWKIRLKAGDLPPKAGALGVSVFVWYENHRQALTWLLFRWYEAFWGWVANHCSCNFSNIKAQLHDPSNHRLPGFPCVSSLGRPLSTKKFLTLSSFIIHWKLCFDGEHENVNSFRHGGCKWYCEWIIGT